MAQEKKTTAKTDDERRREATRTVTAMLDAAVTHALEASTRPEARALAQKGYVALEAPDATIAAMAERMVAARALEDGAPTVIHQPDGGLVREIALRRTRAYEGRFSGEAECRLELIASFWTDEATWPADQWDVSNVVLWSAKPSARWENVGWMSDENPDDLEIVLPDAKYVGRDVASAAAGLMAVAFGAYEPERLGAYEMHCACARA